ncbi:MAG: hypothetical protein QOD86_1491 [Miltoncostaeaceae bacterium]|jgi:hypothetical protein|nr:hypothetical protein [Miltoncostaeaceae bacterium]
MSIQNSRRRYATRLAIVAVVAGTAGAAVQALAASSVTCSVNASVGYVTCLSYTNPGYEQVRALGSSGVPYRFQLRRASDGATWGAWQYSDTSVHVKVLQLTGTIRAQVDNLGTGNPSSYAVEMG